MIELARFRDAFPGRSDEDLTRLRDGFYAVARDWIKSHGWAAEQWARAFSSAALRQQLIDLGIADENGDPLPRDYPHDYDDDDPGAWA